MGTFGELVGILKQHNLYTEGSRKARGPNFIDLRVVFQQPEFAPPEDADLDDEPPFTGTPIPTTNAGLDAGLDANAAATSANDDFSDLFHTEANEEQCPTFDKPSYELDSPRTPSRAPASHPLDAPLTVRIPAYRSPTPDTPSPPPPSQYRPSFRSRDGTAGSHRLLLNCRIESITVATTTTEGEVRLHEAECETSEYISIAKNWRDDRDREGYKASQGSNYLGEGSSKFCIFVSVSF
jgi:hypothetical protein